MTKLAIALLVASSCLFGIVGVIIGGYLVQNAAPVSAAPAAPAAPIKIGLFNLEKAARASETFKLRKGDYELREAALQSERRRRNAELEDLKECANEAESRDDETTKTLRILVKAKEQEIEFAEEFYKHYLRELRDQFLKEVLADVYNKAKVVVAKKGFNLVLQDHTLSDSARITFFDDKSWTDVLMNKAVLFVPPNDPYVTDLSGD